MAETDDQRRKPPSDPPPSLGDLAAGLSDSSSAGEEADEPIDSAALAALSKAASDRSAGSDDAAASVRLADVPAELAEIKPATPSPLPVPPQGRGMGAIAAAVAVGFALGLPAGGFLFSSGETSQVDAARRPPEPAPPPAAPPRAAARSSEDLAAVVRLPRPGMNARVAEPPAPSAEPEQASAQPAAAEPAQMMELSDAQRLRAPSKPAPAVKPQPAANSGTPPAAEVASPAAPPKPAVVVPEGPDTRSVDDLLDQALAQSGGQREVPDRAQRALAPSPGVPLAPSREDVTRAMTVLLPAIRGCAGGASGLATVGIVVRNDGHVDSASVTGAPFEGARSGRCMEGVVRKAKFPRFQQSSFRVQFPFAIQ